MKLASIFDPPKRATEILSRIGEGNISFQDYDYGGSLGCGIISPSGKRAGWIIRRVAYWDNGFHHDDNYNSIDHRIEGVEYPILIKPAFDIDDMDEDDFGELLDRMAA